MQRIASLIGSVFFAAAISAVPFAHAAELPAHVSSCKIPKTNFTQLTETQTNPRLDYLAAIREELVIRKSLLHAIVDCSRQDAQDLKTKVDNELGLMSDQTAQTLGTQLSTQLGDAVRHYESEGDKIDTLALRGSQAFASDLKEWRANTYIPLENQALKFAIWAKNQDLIVAAQNRLNQIGLTVKLLKLVDNDEISEFFDKAKTNLAIATDQNAQAFALLSDPNATDDPLTREKSALDALSATYADFFDLSRAFAKILPH